MVIANVPPGFSILAVWDCQTFYTVPDNPLELGMAFKDLATEVAYPHFGSA